jgi:nucleoid DNA-binding protein
MTSTSEIKRELISIISDYKETMSKDLEQALENLHDEIESDKENE